MSHHLNRHKTLYMGSIAEAVKWGANYPLKTDEGLQFSTGRNMT